MPEQVVIPPDMSSSTATQRDAGANWRSSGMPRRPVSMNFSSSHFDGAGATAGSFLGFAHGGEDVFHAHEEQRGGDGVSSEDEGDEVSAGNGRHNNDEGVFDLEW